MFPGRTHIDVHRVYGDETAEKEVWEYLCAHPLKLAPEQEQRMPLEQWIRQVDRGEISKRTWLLQVLQRLHRFTARFTCKLEEGGRKTETATTQRFFFVSACVSHVLWFALRSQYSRFSVGGCWRWSYKGSCVEGESLSLVGSNISWW